MRKLASIYIFILIACASQPIDTCPGGLCQESTSNHSLEPYITATASFPSTPNIVIPETPLPSPTPIIYIVEAGDTFSELSEKYSISQDDLRAANPDVDPNSMAIGMTLFIPGSLAATANAVTPTPVPVPFTQTVCHPTADDGLWCFALIQNNTPDILENISAQITLLDENNDILASQTAFTPLDIIPPNSSLPVYVFLPNMSAGVNIQVQLLSAIQLNSNNTRYLSAILNNAITQVDWDGLTAQLSGQINLPAESRAATQVWIAATAYDKSGRIVGVKRWEGGAIQAGGNLPFNFSVSSLASAIDTVEFALQVKP